MINRMGIFVIPILIKRLILIFLFLGTGLAYPNTPEPDKIFVHLDKTFYVSGENIHFSIYFLNREPVESGIVHVELLDSEDSIHINQILPVSNNTASGKFELPIELREGNYLFRCYTAWNINFGNDYMYYQILPIYNEWLTGSIDMQNIDLASIPDTEDTKSDNDQWIITLENKDPIHPDERISLELQTRDQIPAYFSIAVFDLNLVQPVNMVEFDEYMVQLTRRPGDGITIKYEPEKSIRIIGKILEQNTNDPVSSNVLSVYNRQEASFTRLKSKNGNFYYELPLFEGIIDLQVINMNPYQEKAPIIQIETLTSGIINEISPSQNLERTPDVDKYLYFSKLRRHINEVFYTSSTDSISLLSAPYFEFIPDKTYDMENYRYIKNVEDFVRQAVVNATSYKEGDSRKLKLHNSETKKYFMTKPWLMVDNYFIFDDSLVYNIPFSQLKRIDVFNTNQSIFQYFEPIMVQGGVIAVYTKNNFLASYIDKSPNIIKLKGLPENETVDISNTDKPGPDLEPMIHWEAQLNTDDRGHAEVSFQTNQVTGNCMIQVIGINENGQLLEGKIIYRVSGKKASN